MRVMADNHETAQHLMNEDFRQYELALESIGEAVTIVAPDNRIVYANSACEQIYCYSKAELIGQPITIYVPPGEVLVDDEMVHDAPGEKWEGEVVRVRKRGERFSALLTSSLIRDRDQEVIGRVAVHRDITQRKRLEEQLFRAQKMEVVGRLAGGVAHDFNNMLTPVISYAQLAVEALPPESQLHGYLQEVEKAAQRASRLMRQLLAFSRSGIVELKIINLNDLIITMDKMLRRFISADIELVTLPGSDLGMVKVDPSQMEQVLVNLVVNARDAMLDGGKLAIETGEVSVNSDYARRHPQAAAGRYVTLAVSDTGIGMSQEVKAHIFEPFFTAKEPGKGTGLGLSTCYGIVTQAGGHITVDSEPGQGTNLKIFLPRVDESADTLPMRHDTGPIPLGSETVLLVEDEPMVRDVASHLLRQQGYSVLEASNGHEALKVAQEQVAGRIDLLLTDVVMPLMGDWELAELLSEIRPEAKVLYITGYTDDSIARRIALGDGTDFMQKPFTPAELAHKVREVLER